MADFIYGLVNWGWVGLQYTTKAGAAIHRRGASIIQRRRDTRTRRAAREQPTVYHSPTEDLGELEHQPLASGSYIRVLHLKPGHGSAFVCCSLEEVDLDSQPEFDALSYCWGDASDTRIIDCDGCHASIGKNLYDALLRLRKPDTSLRLWADALCINQNDLEERKNQVQLMGRIYRQCSRCIVWLGPHTESDGLAFKLLEVIRDFLQAHPSDRDCSALVPDRVLGKFSTTLGQWEALSDLFARPWFERVWTLQEIVLAPQAIITLGKFTLDAQGFYDRVDFLHSSEFAARMIGLEGGYLHSLKVSALRKQVRQHGQRRMDLFETLRHARNRCATDQRDKVMGVLGLCQVDHQWSSTLGYDMSPTEVYTSVAKHCLLSPEPFQLFAACSPISRTSGSGAGLPSWVPDWGNKVALVPCIQSFERRQFYRAGGSYLPKIDASRSVQGFEILSIPGLIVSSLESLISKHSTALKQEFQDKYYPKTSVWEKIGDWYFKIAFAWVFDCLDDKDWKGPEMTIDQFFLKSSWSKARTCCDATAFWQTMSCALTDSRQEEALAFRKKLMKYMHSDFEHDPNDKVQAAFLQNLESWTQVRTFCATSNGQIGWVPNEAQDGDVLCVFKGSRLPYVLRPTVDKSAYTMIGHCFIHGIMFGEALVDQETPLERIVLQ